MALTTSNGASGRVLALGSKWSVRLGFNSSLGQFPLPAAEMPGGGE